MKETENMQYYQGYEEMYFHILLVRVFIGIISLKKNLLNC